MNKHEKILQKIKKCLALAQSSNANEAAVALGQAQKLMAEYGVEMADIEILDVVEESTKKEKAMSRNEWDMHLVNTIAQAFNCKPLLSGGWNGTCWTFIGVGASPEIAAYTYQVLKRQLMKSRKEYMDTALKRIIRKNKIRRADVFCEAWVATIYRSIKAFASPETDEKINTYMEKHYSNAKVATGINRTEKIKNSNRSWGDYLAGAEAAEGVSLNRPVSGQGATGLLGAKL